MKKRYVVFILGLFFLFQACNKSQQTEKKQTIVNLTEFKNIQLLAPDTLNIASLMEALKNRKSTREYDTKNLSLEDLSNLMWSAYGINREDGKRTVPSAWGLYPVKVYAVLANGIFYYNAEKNELEAIAKGDFRKLTGGQDFVYTAPLNILYVADFNKYEGSPVPKDRYLYFAGIDAAHSSQNVYLYCAAFGLKSVIRAGVGDETKLLEMLNLKDNHNILLAQTVGY